MKLSNQKYPSANARPALILIVAVMLLEACSSGKSAYKHGDYYDAVLTAVQRLRQNPDHKKSKEVLSLSYQAAVDYLQADVQNQINSNANFKYKSAVQDYERINYLYEQVKASPGALRVIPSPVSKYKELTEMKNKAAEESYEAGIQSMMKNTRNDSKNAYFLFTDANNFSPGYRESIELIEKSRDDATVKVVVESGVGNMYDWNFALFFFENPPINFLNFFPPRKEKKSKPARTNHFLRVFENVS